MVNADRIARFPTSVKKGERYSIEVRRNPRYQTCGVTEGGEGVVSSAAPPTAKVVCEDLKIDPLALPTLPVVLGSISGLSASGLHLQLLSNDGEVLETSIVPSTAKSFAFERAPTVSAGGSVNGYVVVGQQPVGQACEVLGHVGDLPETTLQVVCHRVSTAAGFNLETTSIAVTVEEGEEPAPQIVWGSVVGANAPVTFYVEHNDAAVAWAGARQARTTTSGFIWFGLKAANYNRSPSPGTYKDTIKVYACYDTSCKSQVPGSPKQIQVEYTIRRETPPTPLSVSQRAVAFTQAPGHSRLSHNISVTPPSGSDGDWIAETDAHWLNVFTDTANGVLSLNASPAGLSTGMHYATVTLSSPGHPDNVSVPVKVGLFVSTATPASELASGTGASKTSPYYMQRVADPLRPWLYVPKDKQVLAVNVYSGQTERTLTFDNPVWQVLPSDDGQRLYVYDSQYTTHVFDGERLELINRYKCNRLDASNSTGEYDGFPLMLQVRVENTAYLVQSNCHGTMFLEPDTGRLAGMMNGLMGIDRYAVSRAGDVGYHLLSRWSGIRIGHRLAFRKTASGEVYVLTASDYIQWPSTQGLSDLAVVLSGDELCGASTGSTIITCVDGLSLKYTIPHFSIEPDALVYDVEASDADVIYGAIYWGNSGMAKIKRLDRRATAPAWTDVATVMAGPYVKPGEMRLSSDGLRLVFDQLMLSTP
ncbi:hypothetical protein WNB94_07235 [Aquabacterium sp. A3]|uniref:hypothetical protein n=1 Tax=Aquabacterium sp. A3 TaxID=3132829 RepID=UPI003119B5E1